MFTDLLTDYRRKPNNIKLLEILNGEFDEIRELLVLIGDWREIDSAKGAVLDDIGKGLDVNRNGLRDEIYRIMIKSKLISNASGGDVYTVVRLINSLLELEEGEFEISEPYHEDPKLAGNITVEKLPLQAMLQKGLSVDDFTELIKATLAAGIGIAKLEVAGTFDFVDELVTGSDTGFADLEMTTGGTLSEIFEEG